MQLLLLRPLLSPLVPAPVLGVQLRAGTGDGAAAGAAVASGAAMSNALHTPRAGNAYSLASKIRDRQRTCCKLGVLGRHTVKTKPETCKKFPHPTPISCTRKKWDAEHENGKVLKYFQHEF